MWTLTSVILQTSLDVGIAAQIALVVATSALAISTYFLTKSSRAHERLSKIQATEVHVQTLALIRPRVAIRKVYRVNETTGQLEIRNAGNGSACNVRAIISWLGTEHQIPKNPDGFFLLAVGDTRSLNFDLPVEVQTVDVKMIYTDQIDTQYEGIRTFVRVRTS